MLENEKKSDRTRRHLIDISLKAFQREGFDNCTMRSLAKEAQVTAPAFYYYFGSKEEIVAAFYKESLELHLLKARKIVTEKTALTENLKEVILSRFSEFSEHRRALVALKKFALERDHPFSPFHENHKGIRQASVDLFVSLIETSKLKWPDKTKRDLAQILWLYHLLILFYWIGDESQGQKKTRDLLTRSLSHLSAALFLLRLPGGQRTFVTLCETLRHAGLMEVL